MNLHSIGLQSDLLFFNQNSIITHQPDHLIIKTPQNPTFFQGNLLIYNHPPSSTHLTNWEDAANQAFSDQPLTAHRCFAWDINPADPLTDPITSKAVATFESANYEYEQSIILTTNTINSPKHPNSDIHIKPITAPAHWQAVTELQIDIGSKTYNEKLYRPFMLQRIKDWQHMINNNQGIWLGAFLGNTLAADLGFFWNQSLSRFQHVETHPDHRNQGICATLVHHACQLALNQNPQTTLVMEADESYHAARIYQSLGFAPTERISYLTKYNKQIWNA
ncbi:hypothetical protein KS4_00370 [Poriferisphaera corsica]|uniref:N-acetyltransferase domain-containing protein n=1 Tax=Poriferisphaera corsica TaxID=2528020 RepID=A0A517YP70_9BACT|nr:GNAT family N-acetyltransferase [Poriferisphaera corsica]QDU32009.1 hypothetical protein KS4_00370 [Poriferisphaera corsica]